MPAVDFALNHIAAPRLDVAAFAALARSLGVTAIEVRNDLPGVALRDGTPPAVVRAAAAAAGIAILSVNALQRFEQWTAERAGQAIALADAAAACGARALVLCPTNDTADARSAARRAEDLRAALRALRPILAGRGLLGFVEPLGFAECALRLKSDAIAAIDDASGGDVFRVLHDTFHHFVAGEAASFPERTGLVHVSGVEGDVAREHMRDPHRVLVGPADRTGTLGQIAALREGGYAGAFSFEPFSPAIHALRDPAAALRASMAHVAGS